MSLVKFALFALCCKFSLAAVISEESGDCASFPKEETGAHVMLQSSESRRTVGVHAPSAKKDAKSLVSTGRESGKSGSKMMGAPCMCEKANHRWMPCTRSQAKCVFIDLGAADGNTFSVFLGNGYGNRANCTNGADNWEAVLVEANPKFEKKLTEEASKYPTGKVTALHSTAAYMCEGTTSFFLDTVNVEQNSWGSSMSSNHPDVTKSGKQNVTVPTMNLNRILAEHTIPGDYVIVKMDIEGAEFDTLPCVAESPSASLIDALYLEQHSADWGQIGTTVEQFEAAKNTLLSKGVKIPAYESPTL